MNIGLNVFVDTEGGGGGGVEIIIGANGIPTATDWHDMRLVGSYQFFDSNQSTNRPTNFNIPSPGNTVDYKVMIWGAGNDKVAQIVKGNQMWYGKVNQLFNRSLYPVANAILVNTGSSGSQNWSIVETIGIMSSWYDALNELTTQGYYLIYDGDSSDRPSIFPDFQQLDSETGGMWYAELVGTGLNRVVTLHAIGTGLLYKWKLSGNVITRVGGPVTTVMNPGDDMPTHNMIGDFMIVGLTKYEWIAGPGGRGSWMV